MNTTFEPRMISKFKTLMSRSRFPLIRGFAGGNPPVGPWSGNSAVRNYGAQIARHSVPERSSVSRMTFDPGAPRWHRPFPQSYRNGGVPNQNQPWSPPVMYRGAPGMNRCPFPRPHFPFSIRPATVSPPVPFPGYLHQVPAPMIDSIPPTTGGWSTGVYSPALIGSQQLMRMIPSC